ncbi:unnamed protein product [Symbiodinium natans]|uniref:Uncharacterized protein n=1 Tax=Symbiodinium natans TaxID=878477 RepID=A0A812UUA6_9DINO|nr:unnamed protein product [Symbiodinium natans]
MSGDVDEMGPYHLNRHAEGVWYFEVKLGGSRAGEVAKQLPPGRPHLRAVRLCLCEHLDRAAGASVAWPRPGLLCVYLALATSHGTSSATHWLLQAHEDGSLADAVKGSLLRSAPRGYEVLEIESLSLPLVVKDFWVNVAEDVLDLGVELSGAPLHEASIVRAFLGGLVWGHGLQARDLLVWIEGRPTAEMSPEEVSEELRAVRPLRLGFVRLASEGFEVRAATPGTVRSPGPDLNAVDQELQELRERRQHLQQLQQKLVEVQKDISRVRSTTLFQIRFSNMAAPRRHSREQGSQLKLDLVDLAVWVRHRKDISRARSTTLSQIRFSNMAAPRRHSREQGSQLKLDLVDLAVWVRHRKHISRARSTTLSQIRFSNMAAPRRHSREQGSQLKLDLVDLAVWVRHPQWKDISRVRSTTLFQIRFSNMAAPRIHSLEQGSQLKLDLVDLAVWVRPQPLSQEGHQQGSQHHTFPDPLQQHGGSPQTFPGAGLATEAGLGGPGGVGATQVGPGQSDPGSFLGGLDAGSAALVQGSHEAMEALRSQAEGLGVEVLQGSAEGSTLEEVAELQKPGEEREEQALESKEPGPAESSEAELRAMCEKQEQEVLLPALAQAKAESEEAAARGFYAREAAMEEVAGQLQEVREEKAQAAAASEEAEARTWMREAELQARYDTQEEEVLLPAIAAARAEKEEAAARGFYAREAAMEEVATELQRIREEQTQAAVASDEAEEKLEMAKAREKVTGECEEAAAKEVKNWEELLQQREKEILSQSEMRDREREAELQARYEKKEREVLLPAVAAAKAESEEAAARGFYAREAAMEEVAGELRKFREEQSHAILTREEAQEAIAKAVRQESLTRQMENQAALEVSKWEAELAAREQSLRSQQQHREREYLGEAKTEQQLASALRVRELALSAGEEDLRAKLRSREHVILQEQREMEGLERRAEEMMALAQKRRQQLLVEEQKEAEALELRAREQARELLARAEAQRDALQGEARSEAQQGLEAAEQRAQELLQGAEERREQVVLEEQRELEAMEKQVEELTAEKHAQAVFLAGKIWKADLRGLGRSCIRFCLPDGGSPIPAPAAAGLDPDEAGAVSSALYTMRQDCEDVADAYVMETVLQAFPKPDGPRLGLIVVLHFCTELGPQGPSTGEDVLASLESMEEGVLQTRRSLRLVRSAHGLVSSGGALVFILPDKEADSRLQSLYAAAQKTSRIVDQNPLKQEDGSPCTFALQCCDEGPRVSAKLIFAWLQELGRTPAASWALLGAGSVVSLEPR